jgi:hypothetical protein
VGDTLSGTSKKLEVCASMNKYRARADMWLGIGARPDGVIGMMMFNREPWRQTKDMDDALEFYKKNSNGQIINIDYRNTDTIAN